MAASSRTWLALLASLASLGCGGDSPGIRPAAIDVRVEPARTWYHTGQDVLLRAVVTDASGDELEDVEVRWSVEPVSAAVAGDAEADPRRARFTLEAPGRALFTGCVGSLCDTVTVHVDDGMPVLEVETPTPGAELDDPEGIVVRGSVSDRSTPRVYVNGEVVSVDDLGQFETAVPARFGVSHLVVEASDGLTDPSTVEMDVLWAPAYAPALAADGRPELSLDEGMALWLGQGFFDDGAPLDTTADAVTTRDLADLLELVVSRIDTAGLVPDPVIDDPPTFTLRVGSVTLGEPQAEIDLTDTGADVFVRIGAIGGETSGTLDIDGTALPLGGTLSASAVAFAEVSIRKESEEDALEVTLGETVIGLQSLDGTFDDDETQAVFRLAEGLLRTTLEDALVDLVREALEDALPSFLREALESLDGALAGRTLPVDSPPFPAVTVELDGRLRSLSTTFRGSLLASLRMTVGADVESVHPDSRGVPTIGATEMSPAFFRDAPLSLAVRLSALDGVLHALWSAGLLDVDVTPLLPDAVTGLVGEAHIAGRLPPVLRPARDGEPTDLVLSVGQLELEVTYMGEPVRFGVSLEAGVDVEVEDNRVAIAIAETPSLRVWTIVPPSDPRTLTAENVLELLTTLWPDLRASVGEGLAFELPLPSPGDAGGLAPDLAELTLALEPDGRVRAHDGVLLLDARLVGTLP